MSSKGQKFWIADLELLPCWVQFSSAVTKGGIMLVQRAVGNVSLSVPVPNQWAYPRHKVALNSCPSRDIPRRRVRVTLCWAAEDRA